VVAPDANFIWSIADLLRGPYRPKEYGTVVLPFTVLARFEALLKATKDEVLAVAEKVEGRPPLVKRQMLRKASGQAFYNTSPYSLSKLGDQNQLAANLTNLIDGYDPDVREVFEKFEMYKIIEDLDERDRLPIIVKRFASLDMDPKHVTNEQMGHVFEELIRRFMEASKDTAGEFFTPREVIRLMVSLLFSSEDDTLSDEHALRQVYDPTCGTGGMLSAAHEWLAEHNPNARLTLFGQEVNARAYAMAKADLIIKGQEASNLVHADTLSVEGHPDQTFSYCLANPPFGQDWKVQQKAVKAERERDGNEGRFAAGVPGVGDGAMLFLQHLVSKIRPMSQGGGRGAIVLNGSPLFAGGAGSGESEIRRHLLKNDLVEAIIGLPRDMFYNTGISTYIWVLTNKKSPAREGTVQLIDATSMSVKLRKSLGDKRRMLSDENIEQIVRLHGEFKDTDPEFSKLLKNDDFGYRTITIERPLHLVFSVTHEKVEAVMKLKAVMALDRDSRHDLRAALESIPMVQLWMSGDEFDKTLTTAIADHSLRLGAAVRKDILKILSDTSPEGDMVTDHKGNPQPDSALRVTENVPLNEDIEEYVDREVLPWFPDAWVDETKTKIGYEIPFSRVFYKYVPPRPLTEIDADVQMAIAKVQALFDSVKS
jgi:type I restriction enzyme M protein